MNLIIWIIINFYILQNNENSIKQKKYFYEKDWTHIKETIISKNVKLITEYLGASDACRFWDIFLEETWKKEKIFEKVENKIYCSPRIDKIDKENAKIYICYKSGAWSWECGTVLFKYNIKNKTWKYISHWYFTHDFWHKVFFEKDEIFEEFFKFFSEKYNLK